MKEAATGFCSLACAPSTNFPPTPPLLFKMIFNNSRGSSRHKFIECHVAKYSLIKKILRLVTHMYTDL